MAAYLAATHPGPAAAAAWGGKGGSWGIYRREGARKGGGGRVLLGLGAAGLAGARGEEAGWALGPGGALLSLFF